MGLVNSSVAVTATLGGLGLGLAIGTALAVAAHGAIAMDPKR